MWVLRGCIAWYHVRACGPGDVMRGRGHHAGRAARKRRQKRESAVQSGMNQSSSCLLFKTVSLLPAVSTQMCPSLCVSSVSMCHQLPYVRLMKFLHQRGFTSTPLQPALFAGTTCRLSASATCNLTPPVWWSDWWAEHLTLKFMFDASCYHRHGERTSSSQRHKGKSAPDWMDYARFMRFILLVSYLKVCHRK